MVASTRAGVSHRHGYKVLRAKARWHRLNTSRRAFMTGIRVVDSEYQGAE